MVSIVFVTANRAAELKLAIISCLDKIFEPFEILVIDNNSTDDTQNVCSELGLQLGSRMRYIFNDNNIGVARARNLGYSEALGDIIYFLDDDAIVQPSKMSISDVAAFMRSNEQYPVVATEIYNTKGKYFQHGAFKKGFNHTSNGLVFNYIGASHFINKKVVQIASLYPDEFFYGGEEYFFSYLQLSKQKKIFYFHDFSINHNPSLSTRMNSDEMLINTYCNAFTVKRYFTPTIFQPVIWGVMILRMLLRCYRKPTIFTAFFRKITSNYNPKYDQPIAFVPFVRLIRTFGLRIVL